MAPIQKHFFNKLQSLLIEPSVAELCRPNRSQLVCSPTIVRHQITSLSRGTAQNMALFSLILVGMMSMYPVESVRSRLKSRQRPHLITERYDLTLTFFFGLYVQKIKETKTDMEHRAIPLP